MFFLNLSAAEFFAILGTLGGVITALYLLDRSKRKKIVSTLRFWTPALRADEKQKRKRVREPWSLLLQLVSLLLLLLALAQVEWGRREPQLRNYVLLLDTSSATGQRVGSGTLLDQGKALADQYLSRLPSQDKVMLVRADGLATPVTPYTSDRAQLINEVNGSASSYSALDINRVLSYAQQAQRWSSGASGEIVYIGPGRIADGSGVRADPGLALRVIAVEAPAENCGIRGMGITRGAAQHSWHAIVRIKNYGSEQRVVRLRVQFAGTSFAVRKLLLQPGQESTAEYEFLTSGAGQLKARIEPGDAIVADDEASVAIPDDRMARIAVFTSRPELWRPLLGSTSRLEVQYLPTSRYEVKPVADLMIVDQFGPSKQPEIASLWIDPPKGSTPFPVNSTGTDQVIKHWNIDAELGAGLRASDVRVPRAEVFQTLEGDIAVASVAAGPAVVARPSQGLQPKIAVVGFDLLSGPLRFEISSPLLFANLVRWLSPQTFRTVQLRADRVGVAEIALDGSELPNLVRVADQTGRAVPFTLQQNRLQFYVEAPAIVHITSGQQERIVSLVLPDIAEYQWKPGPQTARGLPGGTESRAMAVGLWQALALLGGLGLLVEWMLFGRSRVGRARLPASQPPMPRRAEAERELASK